MHEQIGNSPFGLISVTSNGNAVTGIRFLQDGETDASKADNVSRETWQQIEQWCAGERQEFDLPLAPPVSASLHEWLTVLGRIPYGHTVTYKEFALRAGKPEAPRAAGTAFRLSARASVLIERRNTPLGVVLCRLFGASLR